MIRWLAFAVLAGSLASSGPSLADERILSFDSNLAVQADGSLEVTENIRVRAEGVNIRRGIYRDFPTRYTDRYGNRVVVDFELLAVERNGKPEPSFIETRANGVRINTGNDDFLPTPADFTFAIRYRSSRQLGFFDEHDELYWNVTGLDWSFPIDAVQARVTLPAPVPSSALRLDAYTGAGGAQGRDFEAVSTAPGSAVFRSTRSLSPGEGMTISVGFPKGLIAPPTRADKWRWFLRDNRGVLVGIAGLLLLAGFYLWRWMRVGRDPHSGPIFPRYEPPADFAPGELRMLRRMGNDQICFSSDVVDMAVRGFLHIHQGKGSDGWRLTRVQGASTESLAAAQRALAGSLFKGGMEIELKNTNASRVSGALTAHAAEMSRRLKPRYFQTNGRNLVIGILCSALIWVLALVLSGGNGIPVLMGLAVVAVVLHIVFARLLKAPTQEGRKLMDEIEGLRMYLGVAERDELKSLAGPGESPTLDARRYEALLPYAMALGVEEAWTGKFTQAVGEAVAQQTSPNWYHGSGSAGRMGLASMGSSLASALTSQISASSSPPGSSAGGGGGGSSGGGGGGGGGGGR